MAMAMAMAMGNGTGTAASTPRATSDDDAVTHRGVAVLDDIDNVSAPGSVASRAGSRAGSLAPAGGRIKRAKKSHGPRVATIALVDVEPEEMVGSPVTEQTTMADLATVLVSEGRVSSRAIKIDEFRRAEMLQKKQDAQKRAEEMWRRNQIKRRKVRAAQNKERARRREQIRVGGGGQMDDVSPDEMDSEEEFQVAPDRLTPPRASSEEAYHPVAPDLHHDDEEQVDHADEMFENMFDINNARPDSPGPQDVNALQEDDEQDDEAMAALRAAGFTITDDPASRSDDDDNNPWDDLNGGGMEGEAFDVADYRLALQERRLREFREREQDDGDVVEVDDETRFVNSATYGKNRKSQRWSKMETELFYEVQFRIRVLILLACD